MEHFVNYQVIEPTSDLYEQEMVILLVAEFDIKIFAPSPKRC